MGIDAGFDLYPPLGKSEPEKKLWATFLDEIKERYKNDPVFKVKEDRFEFETGEHPCLLFACHKFRRFGSKITCSRGPATTPYLWSVCEVARRYFGKRIFYWNDGAFYDGYDEYEPRYDWGEVYAAEKLPDEDSESLDTTADKVVASSDTKAALETTG